MKSTRITLSEQFDQRQKDLFKIVNLFGLSSQEAINCSQDLDKIVIKMQKLSDLKPMIEYLTYFHGNQDYFTCHDIFEEQWKKIHPIDKKSVYVGFIQLAVGMYHYRASNFIGAIEMLTNAAKILKNEIDDVYFLGIDGEKLNQLIFKTLRDLMRKRPFSPIEIPIINNSLKSEAIENCNKLGFKWFDPNYEPSINIILKHKLRDRSKIIEKRAQKMKLKTSENNLTFCGLY
ncbi:MAG: hypothetical protein K0R18_3125 [Bacillales bacterium]|jgi:predicted metal-dependent hydrolase|nr:hypothetical protein [Bacillales bacterium]